MIIRVKVGKSNTGKIIIDSNDIDDFYDLRKAIKSKLVHKFRTTEALDIVVKGPKTILEIVCTELLNVESDGIFECGSKRNPFFVQYSTVE